MILSKFLLITAGTTVFAVSKVGKCHGVQKEIASCDNDPCGQEECIDCAWSAWQEWSAPTCTGLCERHRTIATRNNECGKPCEGPKVETKKCPAPCEKPPRDCALSDWSEWAQCDKGCGGGQTFRKRHVVTELQNGGAPCEGELRETKACNEDPCHTTTDCVLSEWGSWESCSKTCDGGEQQRTRTIEVPAKFGGKPCTDSLTEIKGCNSQPCVQGVDCVWGEWESWSACSKSCNGGEKTRNRLIKTAPRNGGMLCDVNSMSEVAACNEDPCDEPIDCALSEWSQWDDCSCSCNGIQQRARFIKVYPSKNGVPCNGALKEIQACNSPISTGGKFWNGKEWKDTSECLPDTTTASPPQDCELGEWSAWTLCTATCNGGLQTRHRIVTQQPKHGGSPCDGDLKEVKGCNSEICVAPTEEGPTPVDCLWSEWDAWGACTVSCGGGEKVRQRQITQMANKVGAPCDHKSSMEVAECNTDPCDSTDCVWDEWSDWGACTCTGLSERHRGIAVHQSGIGKPCQGDKVITKRCPPECLKPPQNCQLSEWSDWSQCTSPCGGGQKYRTRSIIQEAKNQGSTCDNEIVKETLPCNTEICSEPTDCVLGPWDEWSSCSATCGGGQQYRHRQINSHASNGGLSCDDKVLDEVRGCGAIACSDQVNCVWGEWSEWGACSASCGGGMRFRDRSISVAPRNGGTLCEPKSKTEVGKCNTDPCGSGCINGEWDTWGDWSVCSASCGGGYQFRSRKIAVTPNECGVALEGDQQDYRSCNTQACDVEVVDCAFSDWSDWGDCSCECNGIKDRTRRVTTYATGGGRLCEGALKEVAPCNLPGEHYYNADGDLVKANCDSTPVDCVVSEWGEWEECTSPCGGGTTSRARTVITPPSGGGKSCSGCLNEIKGCNKQACSDQVDCKWGEWHSWGACSKPCGGGQKSRFRHIVTMPKHGGMACEEKESAEYAPCNESPCGSVEYCAWSQWSDFSECSTTCGTGIMSRTRSLEITTTAPPDDDDVLITGVLAQIGKGFERIDTSKMDHMFLIFMSGVCMSFSLIGIGYWFIQKRGYYDTQGSETELLQVAFDSVQQAEPFIE